MTTMTRSRRVAAWVLILAWGLVLPGAAHAASGLVHAKNFKSDARDANKRQIPILMLFSSPGCHYCERVKNEYLIPMRQDAAYRKKVIIREVTVGATSALTDFDGTPTTEGAFAAAHNVSIVPTVVVFDNRGNQTSEALIGLMIPDYYFGYLDAAVDEGIRKMRAK
jgi:thioredoxin-related protein